MFAEALGGAADLAVRTLAGTLPPGGRRAGLHEARMWLAVSPLGFLALRLAGRRRAVGLGRFGTLVNDPALGRRILVDAERFRTVGPGTHGELMTRAIGPDALLNMDGEAHERLRRVLGPLFSPAASAALVEAAAAEPIASAADALRRGDAVDLVRLARVVTGRTTFALLGAPPPPEGDEGYLGSYALGEELVGMTVRAIRRGVRAGELERARGLVERLGAPGRAGWETGGGTIGRLRDLGLGWEEARALVVVIVLAGTETVTSAAPRIAALLADHGRLDALGGGDATAVEAAMEAGLRLTTPTEVIVRSAAVDAVLDGVRFRAGRRVFVSIYGMTRWAGLYDGDPEGLRLGEAMPAEIRHAWFGAGPHFCLGAPIAREQLRRVLGMLAAVPGLGIVDRRPARGVLFPAYATLQVRAGR